MTSYMIFWVYLAKYLLEWEMCLASTAEKNETYFMFNKLFL
jgi:hypothetical protein